MKTTKFVWILYAKRRPSESSGRPIHTQRKHEADKFLLTTLEALNTTSDENQKNLYMLKTSLKGDTSRFVLGE